MNNKILEQAKLAKEASIILASASTKLKNRALEKMASVVEKNKDLILKENKKDLDNGKKLVKEGKLTEALLYRLKLDENKIKEIVNGIKGVIKLDDPVGKTLSAIELDKHLELYKVTVPIGVIGAIFESRPDVVPQISSLCLKSGNAVILKGGSEALNSNRILAKILSQAAESIEGIPKGIIQLIETREEVKEMLKMEDYIDLLVPRGSNNFVKFIKDNTRIPVLGHSDGICHVYVDKDADLKKALQICFDAKCQYPAVCNAMETLLVNEEIAKEFLPQICKKYKEANVELRGDEESRKIVGMKSATEEDWKTEYNDLILSIKIVKDVKEAISHINKYGSHHTDSIITENNKTALKFISMVDSACVFRNCSTRFSDGFRFGKGAEVGISTNKTHARGPVGLDGLVIYKYILLGNDQVVASYTGKNAKPFLHKKINKEFKIN